MSPTESFSTDHVDYLQRNGFDPGQLSANSPLTAAPFQLRRLLHIHGVGRPEKLIRPAPGQPLRLISEEMLIGLYGHGIPLAFLVSGTSRGVAIHLGTWGIDESMAESHQQILSTILKSLYPAIEFRSLESKERVLRPLPRSGMAMGIPTSKLPDLFDVALPLDRMIRSLAGATWAVLVLAQPVEESLVTELRNQVLNEMRAVQTSVQPTKVSSPLAEHYLELLKITLKAMSIGQAVGAWRTSAYLLGDESTYQRLASVWQGIFSGDQSLPEPVRVWDNPVSRQLAVGWAMVDDAGTPGPGYYRHLNQYQTLLTSTQLATYVHLPHMETSGFAISAVPMFDVVPARQTDPQSIAIGHILRGGDKTEAQYELAMKALARHVFISGVTGAGKTNTIFVLLKEAQRKGSIPYLVIEPAKTEYRALLHDDEMKQELQIFTLGNENVAPFRMNPFEFPEQIPVSVHIDLLRSVFNASFGLWNPLPQILEQCLHKVYEDRGWNIATNTNFRGKNTPAAFPTLSDLTAEVDRYTQALGYSSEVTGNIRSALLTRLNSLRIGGKGRMLDVQQSFPMKDLLERPTIMELEGMGDDDDKAFMMGLLFIRLVEYWRGLGNATSKQIRHILVIEEAHRLLANVVNTGRVEDASPRAKAVETFANILSEVRAYGQGIIIADQVPVKLARDVIKNTNLKIAHRIVDSEDRQVMAGSMAMTDDQAMRLATLTLGETAIFSEGDDAPLLVAIRPAKDNPEPGQSEAWLDNAQIKTHMAKSAMFRAYPQLLQSHPGCADTGEHAGLTCQAVKNLAETSAFQRTFAQVILTMIVDPSTLNIGWQIIERFVREKLSRIQMPTLLPCLIYHASQVFSQHRGAQGRWSYADTETVQNTLHQTLLDRLENRNWQSHAVQFSDIIKQLYKRYSSSCAYCYQVYETTSPVCLYIHNVNDLVSSRLLETAWMDASSIDSKNQDQRRVESAAVCQDAVLYLLDLNSPEQAQRDAGLCFAAAMLSRDDSKLMFAKQAILNSLIKELRYER